MAKKCAVKIKLILLLCFVAKISLCADPDGIVETAKTFLSSKRWLWKTSLDVRAAAQTDKCHLFVAYVLRMSGALAPNRRSLLYSPISAAEWEDKLHAKRCWELCNSSPVPGDVIAMGGHVGIVTGTQLTTSSSYDVLPLGLIVENNWGFRPGQHPVCWRFKYDKFTCYFILGSW